MASAEQIAALKQAFSAFDSDEIGAVSPELMAGLIQKLGQEPPPVEHLAAFIAKVDAEKAAVAARAKVERSGVVSGEKIEGETPAIRNYRNPSGDFHIEPKLEHQQGVKTMWEVFENSAKKYGDRQCLGRYNEESKAYTWEKYSETHSRAVNIGSGLRKAGINPGDFIGVMLPTCPEWTLTELGAWSQSMCIVTLYETYGVEALKYIVKHSGLRVIVSTGAKVPTVLEMIASMKGDEDAPDIAAIIHVGAVPSDLSNEHNITLVDWASLETNGAQDPVAPNPPGPDDRMFIIYTSGTTGNPKGAVHVHSSMVACISCAINAIPLDETSIHLAFLPLAHIMEQFLESLMFINGASIGFWGGNIRQLMDYIQALKPTAFVGVPRVLNRYYDKIKAGFDAAEGMKKMLIGWAFESKRKSLAKGRYLSYWDPIVFHKAAAALGGRVNFIATGSAPIDPGVVEFFRLVFSCCVVEGYGMTEVLVVSNSPDWDSSTRSHVGPPYESVEMKLVDVPEMSYTSADQPLSRGEICLRGPTLMREYFRNPEKTAETIDKDGWLHTGDIGCFLPDGHLRILDRVKHIFKLAQGEYVAPEKLEQVFIHCRWIAQIFVNGFSTEACLVAVVVPDPEQLENLAKAVGMEGASPAELLTSPKVKQEIIDDLGRVGKEMKLNSYELIRNVHVCGKEFGEQGLLTPTFKLKRNVARDAFGEITKQLYAELK